MVRVLAILACLALSACSGLWEVVEPPSGIGHLYAIHGIADDEVWAVGEGGAIRFDGEEWSLHDVGAGQLLTDVWVAGPDDVWVTGLAGTVMQWDGADWLDRSPAFTDISDDKPDYHSVRVGEDPMVIGEGNLELGQDYESAILRWDGSGWLARAIDASVYSEAAIGGDGDHAWTVTYQTMLQKVGPNDWTEHTDGLAGENEWVDVWVKGDEAWAVSDFDVVFAHWDGTSWTDENNGFADISVGGVWFDDDMVVVVGRGRVIVSEDGAPFQAEWGRGTQTGSMERREMRGVWGAPGGDVWAAGDTLLRRAR